MTNYDLWNISETRKINLKKKKNSCHLLQWQSHKPRFATSPFVEHDHE